MDILLLVFQIKLGLKKEKVSIKKDLSILDVAVLVGFNSQNYYSMVFKSLITLHQLNIKIFITKNIILKGCYFLHILQL